MTDDLGQWWKQLTDQAEARADALHHAWQTLENAGVLNHVVVHRYLCRHRRGHPLATVIRVSGVTVVRTRDYKFSPGLNAERSVETARAKNTLDGERHWPGPTLDVTDLAEWGPQAGVDMNCRHALRTVLAQDILAASADVRPGHPGKPSRI